MKKIHAALVITIIILSLGVSGTAVFAAQLHGTYSERIVPNVFIAGMNLSGMDALAATATLQRAYDRMITDGLTVTVGSTTHTVDLFPTIQGADAAYPLIDWDTNAAVHEALAIGHHTNPLTDSVRVLAHTLFGSTSVMARVTLDTERLQNAIFAAFPETQVPPSPTDFSATFPRGKAPIVTVTPGTDGQTLNTKPTFTTLALDAGDLSLKPITIATIAITPSITTTDAQTLIPKAIAAITAAPYTITGTNTEGDEETWSISQKTIADWIAPTQSDTNRFTVHIAPEKIIDFLTTLHTTIDIGAQNARFMMNEGVVTEFQGSKNGTVVDDDSFFAAFNAALGTATSETPIPVALRTEFASVTTENVNTLGIKEILGEATTTYTTATRNRRANIQHGAEKLNGLLIAPGETASLIAALRPFTLADGYVPELVIKGNEIEPEIAGGLCQIGTTVFRAVMHSGLEVVNRRNHSLAVSYYNDYTNGNPGTDATLYDPNPDFTFTNDFPTYILLAAHADSEKGEVTITFWGTKDGRSGSYTPPTVLTRTPAGATTYTETSALPAGVTQCQHGFTGYTTTFDYNITYANGISKTVPFLSSYRPLPETCLVGKAAETPRE